jgi:hypothetical protein
MVFYFRSGAQGKPELLGKELEARILKSAEMGVLLSAHARQPGFKDRPIELGKPLSLAIAL